MKQSRIAVLSQDLNNTILKLDLQENDSTSTAFKELQKSYNILCNSKKIWNNSARFPVDNSTRSTIEFIECVEKPIHFIDSNDVDFYIYPNIAIAFNQNENLIETFTINELQVHLSSYEQSENGKYPTDSEVIRCTWRFPRKDGGPDLRYTNNYKISVVRYGEINLSFGIHSITYYVSNYKNCIVFEKDLSNFISLIKSQNSMLTESESESKTKELPIKEQEHAVVSKKIDVALINTNQYKNRDSKSSVQIKILAAKMLYQHCTSFEDILDL